MRLNYNSINQEIRILIDNRADIQNEYREKKRILAELKDRKEYMVSKMKKDDIKG